MRKSIVALAAGLSVALSACGGSTGSSTPETTQSGTTTPSASATESKPAAEGSLVLWADETRSAVFKQIGEDFKKKTGISLDVVQKPTGDIAKDLVTQGPSGQGPDLIVTAHDNIGNLVKNGAISDINFANKMKDFSPVAIQAFTYDGKVWGMPYALENIALVRNNKMVKDTPATFDELIAQAKKVPGAQFPIVIQQGEKGDPYHLYPLQMSFGAPVFKATEAGFTKDLAMAGDEGVKFANYLKKLGAEKVLSADIGGDQAKQLFLDGKAPYTITGPWNTTAFTEAGMDISVLPIPSAGGKPAGPFVGAQGVFVSANSKKALVANQFIDFMATKEVQDTLYKTGKRAPALLASAAGIDDPILKGFNEAGKDGMAMPSIPEMGSVWEFWGITEAQIITGKAADPKAAWETMAKNIQAKF